MSDLGTEHWGKGYGKRQQAEDNPRASVLNEHNGCTQVSRCPGGWVFSRAGQFQHFLH